MIYNKDCLYFNGIKPCFPFTICDGCDKYAKIMGHYLYIHTGALGDIVRQMSLLYQLAEEKNNVQITVVTSSLGSALFECVLEDFPYQIKILDIDKTPHHYWSLVQYDRVYNLDRDIRSASLATYVKAKNKYGFKLEKNGSIGVFNKEAALIYRLGLDDQEKFYQNKFYADQVMAESLGLVENARSYNRGYAFKLPQKFSSSTRQLRNQLCSGKKFLLGVNVGVGSTWPYKNLTLRSLEDLIYNIVNKYQASRHLKILLLGGEKERYNIEALLRPLRERVKELDCGGGVEIVDFLTSHPLEGAQIISCLDLLFTSDTLALHLALALKIPVLSWFGPTHPEEIRFNETSFFIRSDFECSPCWSQTCLKEKRCNEDLSLIENIAQKLISYMSHGTWK